MSPNSHRKSSNPFRPPLLHSTPLLSPAWLPRGTGPVGCEAKQLKLKNFIISIGCCWIIGGEWTRNGFFYDENTRKTKRYRFLTISQKPKIIQKNIFYDHSTIRPSINRDGRSIHHNLELAGGWLAGRIVGRFQSMNLDVVASISLKISKIILFPWELCEFLAVPWSQQPLVGSHRHRLAVMRK